MLKGVTAEQAARRPIPGAHTIWELVLHLISWTREVTRRLDEGVARQPPDGDWPAMPEPTGANWAAALRNLSEAHAKLGQALAPVAEPRLAERVGYERDAPLGSGVSYLAMLHGLLQHDTYHLGQIALLKKY